MSHLLVGDDCEHNEQVADQTGQTDRAEHRRQQRYRLQHNDETRRKPREGPPQSCYYCCEHFRTLLDLQPALRYLSQAGNSKPNEHAKKS